MNATTNRILGNAIQDDLVQAKYSQLLPSHIFVRVEKCRLFLRTKIVVFSVFCMRRREKVNLHFLTGLLVNGCTSDKGGLHQTVYQDTTDLDPGVL
jgi:hypothetical protein